MDFSALIKKSLEIALYNRILWLFGFLSGGVGSVGYFNQVGTSWQLLENLQKPNSGSSKVLKAVTDNPNFFLENLILILLIILLVILAILLIAMFITNWAGAALVYSILNRNGERPNWSLGAKAGLKYWWEFFLVAFVLGSLMVAFILSLALPVIFLFLAGMRIVALAVSIPAIVIFVLALLIATPIASLLITLATRIIVHKGVGVMDSLRLAGALLRKNKGESLLAWLVSIGLNFAAGFAITAALLPIILILAMIFIPGFALGFPFWLGAVSGIPALVLLFAVMGFWQAFNATYWTLFYEHVASKEGW
ncbi:MAG: hypothetical protein NC828_06635 [Candidatus Omnitrophica bacterium]|nr:hypothetical protein [Candidatus Omnitrophota bacterium]